LELLRIVSMIMIITLHFLGHGGVLTSVRIFSPVYYFAWFFEGISYVAVNCYVLISGYFLVVSGFNLKKFLVILGQVFFYSVGIYFVLVYIGQIEFNSKALVLSFLPVLSKQYWFVTIYIGMYIMSPFINLAIRAMTSKQHLICIIMTTFLFSIWPNIFFFSGTLSFGGGEGVVWFIVLYLVAAYLRLYYQPSYKMKKYIYIYIIITLLLPLSRFMISMLSITSLSDIFSADLFIKGSSIFYSYNSILVYPSSIALFVLFLNINIKNEYFKKVILLFSPLTFGVYLIHDNKHMRFVLWEYVNAPLYISQWYFPIFMVVIIMLIYLACSFIEKLRKTLFRPIEQSDWLDRLCVRLANIPHKFICESRHLRK